MLQKMRDNAQSFAARVVAGLIVFVLVAFGFGAFNLFQVSPPVAAEVNGDEITQQALLNEAERRKAMLLAQIGEGADPSMIDSQTLLAPTLGAMINRLLLVQAADDLDLAASRRSIDQQILENPDFQLDGRFDEELFRMRVAGLGFSPVGYQQQFAADEKINLLTSAFEQTAILTDRELRNHAALLSQRRDVSYLTFSPEDFRDGIEIDELDVEAYFDDNAYDYMTQESVDVEFVQLRLADLMQAEAASEEEVRAQYEADKLAFEADDRRRAAHILLEIDAERSEADARRLLLEAKSEIEGGRAFADLAERMSQDPGSAVNGGDLGFANRGMFVPEFEEALWALEPGELSDPIRSEFGMHLIQLIEVEAAEYPDYETAKAGIAESIKRRKAQTVFNEKLGLMDEIAFEESDSLRGIVDALGVPVETAMAVTRNAGEGPFENASLREAVFEPDVYQQGFNSRPINVGETAVVVRAVAVHPAEQRLLDEVRAEIETALRDDRARAAALQAADEAFERTEAGDPAAEVAEAFGRSWEVQEGVQRNHPGVPDEVLRAAFALAPPDRLGRSVGRAALADGAQAVITMSRITLGDFGALTESDRAALREQVDALRSRRDVASLIDTLQKEGSITRNY